MNRWTGGGGERTMQKERERALNVYKNVPSGDLQKKERRKSPFESLSGFSSAGFFLLISGMRVCVALESSLVPRERQTASDGGHGRFFLPGFEVQKLTSFFFLFFFFAFWKMSSRRAWSSQTGTDSPGKRANQEVVTRGEKKKRKRNFPECLQLRI